jgi:YVTN family beta-propeller protein
MKTNHALLSTILASTLVSSASAQVYNRPTYSSPIAISQNDRLIWVVNPNDDSVSVIRPDTNTRITKIAVGDEPESVALTPNGQYAYVANAAGSSVSVIQINDRPGAPSVRLSSARSRPVRSRGTSSHRRTGIACSSPIARRTPSRSSTPSPA